MHRNVSNFLFFFLLSVGEIKSSSPSESPLMEKREMVEAHCPILKSVPENTSTLISNTPQSAAHCEERRVTFDIGDSDDAEPKEGELCNGSGEFWGSDLKEHQSRHEGKQIVFIIFLMQFNRIRNLALK